MFRDREEALQALQAQLLEEEADETPEEAMDETPAEDKEEFDAPDVAAWNADTCDTDLERYSEEVYAPRRKGGCALVMMLVTAAVLLFLAYLLAKKEGLL